MKLKMVLAMSLCCILFLSSCSAVQTGSGTSSSELLTQNSEKEAAYHKITAKEAKKMIEENTVTIVDVRTYDEFSQAHLPNAINIPNETIGNQPPELLADKEAILIVYCRTGVRSKQASDKLVKQGYQNVYDMGGIVDWTYETESEVEQ